MFLVVAIGALAGLTGSAQSQTTELPTVDVTPAPIASDVTQTSAGPVRGEQALTAQTGTRTETPIRNLPLSVVVVPTSIITDQGATGQGDALRNVSSVQPVNNLCGECFAPSKLRGFNANRMIDGLPLTIDYGALDALSNVERIEVFKGPGSLLYPAGPFASGGLINVVSKLPTSQQQQTYGLTYGSYGTLKAVFDVNVPIQSDGSVLYRMTGQWDTAGSNIDTLRKRSYDFNPTISFSNLNGTTLVLQGRIGHLEHKDYPGLPPVGTVDTTFFRINPRLYPADPNIPKFQEDVKSLTARLDHDFNSTWSMQTNVRISSFNFSDPAQLTLGQTPSVLSYFVVADAFGASRNTDVSFNTSVRAKFDIGTVHNVLVLGVDHDRTTARSDLEVQAAGLVDFVNPMFPAYHVPVPGFGTYDLKYASVFRSSGATAQLQSNIGEALHLLAGVRLNHLELNEQPRSFGFSPYELRKTSVLPQIGAIYDLTKSVGVFADYSEGIRMVPVIGLVGNPKPESSKQSEAGLKFDTGTGLSGTIAAFELTRFNVVTGDPFNPYLEVQAGEERSRGFDADLLWQPDEHWNFLGSFAHVNARVVRDAFYASGAMVDSVPLNSGRFWGGYRLTDGDLKGLSLGAGIYAASRQAISLDNTYFTPAYAVFDAKIAYERAGWTYSLLGKNLTNHLYFTPYPYGNGRVAVGEGRTVQASVSTKF